MEVIVSSPDGNKSANTSPTKTPEHESSVQPRRFGLADLNGPVGQFLSETLHLLAPDVYTASNWKGKLVTAITDNRASFLCYGRAIGLAQVEREAMRPNVSSVRVLWLIVDVDGGGTKEDAYEVLRAMKRWARSMDGEMILPAQEFTNLPLGKAKDVLKAKDRVVFVVEAKDK